MQSKDGGWAAFDVDNNWEILTHVPFADHNAMLDPTCADITGRTLEALAANGFDRNHPACRRAIDYLDPHAAFRRKLVRPLGRGLHLRHLFRAARPARHGRRRPRAAHPARQRMAAFDSESPMAAGAKAAPVTTTVVYVRRKALPSQTAWALMGLMAGGDTYSSSVQDGIEYLIEDPARRWRLG